MLNLQKSYGMTRYFEDYGWKIEGKYLVNSRRTIKLSKKQISQLKSKLSKVPTNVEIHNTILEMFG